MMHYLPPVDPLWFPSLSLDLSLTVLTPYLPFLYGYHTLTIE